MTNLTWDIIPAKCGYLNSPVKVIFDADSIYKSDIQLVSDDWGAVLTFDPLSQKLTRISIDPRVSCTQDDDPSSGVAIEFVYEGKPVFGRGISADCKRLMSVFPPTTLGSFNEPDLSYSMEYKCGIAFQLKMNTLNQFRTFQSKKEHPIEVDGFSPLIMSMEISDSRSFPVTTYEIYPKEAIRLNGKSWLKLGCGLQDVFALLGPPDDVCGDYYNFFTHGISIKVDKDKFCRVDKFTIYTNFPGHILFGQFNRAVFELAPASKKKEEVTPVNNQSTLPQLEHRLGNAGKPLVVTSPYTTQVQHFYSFDTHGLKFELSPSGGIVSVQVT